MTWLFTLTATNYWFRATIELHSNLLKLKRLSVRAAFLVCKLNCFFFLKPQLYIGQEVSTRLRVECIVGGEVTIKYIRIGITIGAVH